MTGATLSRVLAGVSAGLLALSIGIASQGALKVKDAEADLALVHDSLVVTRGYLMTTERILDSAVSRIKVRQLALDSLTRVVYDLRKAMPVRQYTAVVVDTSDRVAMVAALVTVTAERDTAIADGTELKRRNALQAGVIDHLRADYAAHLSADTAMLAQLAAQNDSATAVVDAVIPVAKRSVLRRVLGVLGRSTRVVVIAGAAYLIGRGT